VRSRLSEVQSISVETYPGIIERVADADKFRPQTRGTADHSLPVCLAMALLDGDVTLNQFEKDRWRSRDVMELVGKTKVSPSASLMAKLPKGRGASVEIVFADGKILRETVEVPEGDSQRPLSQDSLERKFMTSAIPVVGEATAKRIISQVESLETLPNIALLANSLKGRG
jgi:2-methylcitrate dehydratase